MTTAQEIIAKYHLTESSWTHKGFHGILHFFFPVGEFSHDEGNWYWNNGSPQDIEWGIDGHDKLHILQSRPITTPR